MIDQAKVRARRRRCVLAHRRQRRRFYKLGLTREGKPRIYKKQPPRGGLKPEPAPVISRTEAEWRQFRNSL
jgi:hypothetical protein